MIAVSMQRRSRVRYLAPIALIAVIAGTYVVVHSGVNKAASAQHQVKKASGLKRRYARARTYVVQPGDNLTSIAHRTGLTIGALQTLNPHIDPNALQTGQRLRLRR
jgi:LysM repeat protein